MSLRRAGEREKHSADVLREEAVRRLEGLRRQLGENNGITRFALEERRVYRNLEPPAA
ncbi:hypothetical protein [Streptomyces hyaluromycini]|uniref:hypothetical protein n=1 Tax=Streptomyces hyaluromycini TaxID=1377993 RepID=UPI00142E8C92|nr:hypothetical protein [Streptomyces hyaluromycini]